MRRTYRHLMFILFKLQYNDLAQTLFKIFIVLRVPGSITGKEINGKFDWTTPLIITK